MILGNVLGAAPLGADRRAPVAVVQSYYTSPLLTAPFFFIDLGALLPAGQELIVVVGGFGVAGICSSPITGLRQALSGEVQVSKIPTVIRFVGRIPNGTVTIDGIYMGGSRFFY